MNNLMIRAAGTLLLAAFATPSQACEADAAQAMRLKVSSPLTVHQHGPAVDVAVDARGCVTATFPAIDVRHGTRRFQLEGKEFSALVREVQAAGLASFDEAGIAAALRNAPKATGTVEHYSADADLVELELAAGMADTKSASPKRIRWSGVEASLMNHPEVAGLQALAAVKSRLLELTADPRLQQEAAR